MISPLLAFGSPSSTGWRRALAVGYFDATNVLVTTIAFPIARLGRLDSRQSTAIATGLGVHNSTPAIAVAATIASSSRSRPPSTASPMFFTAGRCARLMPRRNAAQEPAAAPV